MIFSCYQLEDQTGANYLMISISHVFEQVIFSCAVGLVGNKILKVQKYFLYCTMCQSVYKWWEDICIQRQLISLSLLLSKIGSNWIISPGLQVWWILVDWQDLSTNWLQPQIINLRIFYIIFSNLDKSQC